jgi:hypothetical protein
MFNIDDKKKIKSNLPKDIEVEKDFPCHMSDFLVRLLQ